MSENNNEVEGGCPLPVNKNRPRLKRYEEP